MNFVCGSAGPGAWLPGLLAAADCHAALLGANGWRALVGSPLFAALLGGLLTLAVARLGLRLMTGGVLPAEMFGLVAHIGVVIALATGWAAYDRLIYRVAVDGPGEVAALVFPAAGLDSASLFERLQNARDAIAPEPEPVIAASPVRPGGQAGGQGAEAVQAPPTSEAASSNAAQDNRKIADVLVIAGAGPWIAARLALALLLALGPFALAASLFPLSAGLFAGWLRGVAGASLATLVVPLSLAIELQMLEAPVQAALARGTDRIPGLEVIVWSFVLVTIGLLVAVQRMAGGLGLPRWRNRTWHDPEAARPALSASPWADHAGPALAAPVATRRVEAAPSLGPSRAMQVAQAMAPRDRASGPMIGAVRPMGRAALMAAATPALLPGRAGADPASGGRPSGRRGSQIVDGTRLAAAGRGGPRSAAAQTTVTQGFRQEDRA